MANNRHSDDPMGRMEISIRNTQDGIQRLFLHSAKHEQAIESLQKDVSSLQKDVSSLQKDVSSLQQDVSSLQQDVSSLQQDVSSLREDVETLRQETRERFDKIEDTLAIIVNHLQK
ncbi:hypothetical protein J7438_13810 [Thalassotalea sp. G20_0]|uniref:coiled-coil domain-containing protein n=1 Tax=Thalassotalea sp. G20_0 TaxID=2821093 RepID=UPI001AD99841|nr:hypothetical protein [Thalassotalea sp. G20_0]MBO9495155.1 hypothetical protein [Thalassotalea sp. G20_0]